MERPATFPVTSRAPTLGERLISIRRRLRPALIAAIAVFAIAAAAAVIWPPTYRSTGTILIEQQEVPSDLVRSMVSSYADQRIQMISQRVMTSENLLRIIDRYGLYPDKRRSEAREELIERMRGDIHFSMISADVVDPRLGRATKATIAFSVSYDSREPLLASKVANELTTLYLNENIESRKQLADDTATFLTTEADRLNEQIVQLSGKLAEFKERHVNSLPELTQLNVQLMSRTEEELRDAETRIRSLDQQVVYLDAQLAQLQPDSQIFTSSGERVLSTADRLKVLKSDYARASAVYSADHPDVLRMKREMDGLQKEVGRIDDGNDLARQLRDAQGQLAEARQRYSPDHPDVKQLERVVETIGQTMREAPLTAESTRSESDNPAFIQVDAQREASINERNSLQAKASGLRAKVKEFEARLSASPGVEREYSNLIRELDNAQVKYREVRQKQMEATLAQNLESERKGERFALIEPPLMPEEPVSPNRVAIVLLGCVLALGSGGAVIAAMEALDGTVRSRRDIETLLAVPPLAVLPWMDTPADQAARTRALRLSIAGAATSVALVAVLVHLAYRPLDVLWEVALRRLLG